MNEKIIEMYLGGYPVIEIAKKCLKSYDATQKTITKYLQSKLTKIELKQAISKMQIDEMIATCKSVTDHVILTVGDVYKEDNNLVLKRNGKKVNLSTND